MKKLTVLIMAVIALFGCTNDSETVVDVQKQKHLFILSGQSNMGALDPDISFTPAVEKKFGKDNVTVVKSAKSGQPIRCWYKKYQFPDKREVSEKDKKSIGNLYITLMDAVKKATEGKKYDTVSFVWMQGERDAREGLSAVYADSFKGILEQIKSDLKIKELNVVIGRLSDFDMKNTKYKHWTKIRDIHVKLAKELDSAAWVNTDDLNDGKNKQGKEIKDDLHYSVEGYKKLGQRFADKAITLITDKAN